MSSVKGREVEDRVAQYLLSLGYTLVTRRFKSSHGEIDLIAIDNGILVFVEVKYRTGTVLSPEESVTRVKANRFESAVAEYLSKTAQPEMPARYDLIAVSPDGLRHHKDFK